MYDGNPGEIDFGSSQREVRVSEGSSYRESTVLISFQYLYFFTFDYLSAYLPPTRRRLVFRSHRGEPETRLTGEEAPKFSWRFSSRDVFVRSRQRAYRTYRARAQAALAEGQNREKETFSLGHVSLRSWRFFGFFFLLYFVKQLRETPVRKLNRGRKSLKTMVHASVTSFPWHPGYILSSMYYCTLRHSVFQKRNIAIINHQSTVEETY